MNRKCHNHSHHERRRKCHHERRRKCHRKKPCGKLKSPDNVSFTVINATNVNTIGKVFWVRNCDTVTVWFNVSMTIKDPTGTPAPVKIQINIPGLPVSKIVTQSGDFNYGQKRFVLSLSGDDPPRLIAYKTEIIEGSNEVAINFTNSFQGFVGTIGLVVENFVTFPIEDPYNC
uniref:Uncharacterized protein n=1 Tax=Pithovirus LCPAC302 TaxID=2506593 RepID=A0A481Z779_9VIRU|nr:MAG: hypothetical protein LCPAC302_02470 [Pithovirus LCPAC302]